MIAFVHINKTAGTNLKYILRRSFGSRHCDVRIWPRQSKEEREQGKRVVSRRDIARSKIIYPGLKSISGHLVTSYSDIIELPDIRFYTFLREPLARTASHYQFMQKNPSFNDSFEEWIQKDHYRNVQTRKIAGESNAEKAIDMLNKHYGMVGLQEHYNESLLLLKKWVNDPDFDVRYQSLNVAKNVHKANELLESAHYRTMLEEANQEDLKLYKYVTEEVYPRQKEAYGQQLETDLAAFMEEIKTFTQTKSKRGKIARGLYWFLLPLISKGKVF